jgi:hypothetical protein
MALLSSVGFESPLVIGDQHFNRERIALRGFDAVEFLQHGVCSALVCLALRWWRLRQIPELDPAPAHYFASLRLE